ncbi:hypothetical protein BH11PSE12_BH11PSE12_05920 [soil metagenome]
MKKKFIRTNLSTWFALLFISIFMCGCASVHDIQTHNALDNSLQIGSARVEMNVKGGNWQGLTSEFNFDQPQGDRFEMTMGSQNFDKKWAPTQALCIGDKLSEERVCINFHALTTAEKDQLAMSETVFDAAGELLERIAIPRYFKVGDKVEVEVSVKKGNLYFKINDNEAISHPLNFIPMTIRFGCSSVRCQFKY